MSILDAIETMSPVLLWRVYAKEVLPPGGRNLYCLLTILNFTAEAAMFA